MSRRRHLMNNSPPCIPIATPQALISDYNRDTADAHNIALGSARAAIFAFETEHDTIADVLTDQFQDQNGHKLQRKSKPLITRSMYRMLEYRI